MDKKRLNPPAEPILHRACFFAWSKVDCLCSALLSGFFHRPVTAEAFEDGSPDRWFLGLDTAISAEELRMLLKSLPADGNIEDANHHGDDPVWGFSQDLSEKVIAQTVPYPIVESKCSDSGLWLICGDTKPDHPAVYAVSVIRRRICGLHDELYLSRFLVSQAVLPVATEDACAALLRNTIRSFLKTEDGHAAYMDTCGDFNWGDADTCIPDEFWAQHGISACPTAIETPFSCCGVIGILVDQDEQLGEGMDEFQDEENIGGGHPQ